MKVSERNFLASQALYGLMIAKKEELPKIGDPVEKWVEVKLDLVDLAFEFADAMLEEGK